MRYVLLVAAIFVSLAYQCSSSKNKSKDTVTPKDSTTARNTGVPDCVKKILNDLGKETPPNQPVRIDEYTYKGKTVYLFTAPCCDQYNTVYDENCQAICAASGGFDGRGDRKCPDFDSLAKRVKTIWTKKE